MADLMNEIAVKFADKWKDIGRGLGLEEYELTQIKVQEQSTNDSFHLCLTNGTQVSEAY